ncbi:MAG: hypothetical protein IKW78_07100 [Prevotella sp.]|nr:hypothetical protein [Prevotella sp.]
MFNFNNNKRENDLPPQDLEELFQRLEHLERKCRRMETRIEELEAKITAPTASETPSEAVPVAETEVESVGINLDNAAANLMGKPIEMPLGKPIEMPLEEPQTAESFGERSEIFYLAAPNPDGTFSQASAVEQIGKSIYQLTTADGQNGTFILLDTPDAIATAMISVSQFVKPACKISGNTAIQPRHIITEEEGAASREGTGWKITRKAVVRFE